jgi:Tol biopolymer transport system component
VRSALGTIRHVALQVTGLLVIGMAGTPQAQAQTAGVIVYEQFEGSGTNHQSDIWMMNPDGSGQTNLTNTPDSQEYDPELSPDGTEVAFISDRPDPSNEDGNYEIFTLTIADGTVRQVTDTANVDPGDFVQSYDPTWSPDGTMIAFNGFRESSSSEIFTINADGSGGETKLTDPADFAGKWDPDWSPDGTKILFTWGFSHAWDLHTINPDGTEETNLTPDPDEDTYSAERHGTWSPDGTRIAFDTDRHCCGNYPNPNTEIYVMEYPSLQLTRVTEQPYGGDQPQDEDPTWSPDGSQLVFTSDRNGGYDLFVVDAPPVPAPQAKTASMFSFFEGEAATADEPQPLNTAAGDQSDPFWGGAGGGTVPPPPTCQGQDADNVSTNGLIEGTPGDDVLAGGSSANTIRGFGGNDVICGGGGQDTVTGGNGADELFGQAGPDTLKGGDGRDYLVGGRGTDTCAGGTGSDRATGCETKTSLP